MAPTAVAQLMPPRIGDRLVEEQMSQGTDRGQRSRADNFGNSAQTTSKKTIHPGGECPTGPSQNQELEQAALWSDTRSRWFNLAGPADWGRPKPN